MAVCEIGGGANQLLTRQAPGALAITYKLVDIDERELAKAPEDTRKVHLEIIHEAAKSFDVVVYQKVAEHVRGPEEMHRNIKPCCGRAAAGSRFTSFRRSTRRAPSSIA